MDQLRNGLKRIRAPEHGTPAWKKVLIACLALLLGAALGAFSKSLDCTPGNLQPWLFQRLDVGNFLGRFPFWVLVAVLWSVFSKTPLQAAARVFLFFAGMVSSYYAYTKFVAGFFPRSYALVWCVLTLLSPLLAVICWYARGKGWPALVISAAISGFLFCQGFAFGRWYLEPVYEGLDALAWLAGSLALYQRPGQFGAMLGLSLVFALLFEMCLPFGL